MDLLARALQDNGYPEAEARRMAKPAFLLLLHLLQSFQKLRQQQQQLMQQYAEGIRRRWEAVSLLVRNRRRAAAVFFFRRRRPDVHLEVLLGDDAPDAPDAVRRLLAAGAELDGAAALHSGAACDSAA